MSGSEDEGLGFSKPSLTALFSLGLEADRDLHSNGLEHPAMAVFFPSVREGIMMKDTTILQSRPKNEAFEDQISS